MLLTLSIRSNRTTVLQGVTKFLGVPATNEVLAAIVRSSKVSASLEQMRTRSDTCALH